MSFGTTQPAWHNPGLGFYQGLGLRFRVNVRVRVRVRVRVWVGLTDIDRSRIPKVGKIK